MNFLPRKTEAAQFDVSWKVPAILYYAKRNYHTRYDLRSEFPHIPAHPEPPGQVPGRHLIARSLSVLSQKPHRRQRAADRGLAGPEAEEEPRHLHPAHGQRDAAGRGPGRAGRRVCDAQPGERRRLRARQKQV